MGDAMSSLKDVAQYVRSKNAGPFWVTIDIFCSDRASFKRVAAAPGLEARAIARLYGVDAARVARFTDERLNILKISFPRKHVQGSPADRDSHAGQYFVPLLDVEIT